MRIVIHDDEKGDIVKVFDNWDDADEWLKWNQENFSYTPVEEG